MSNDSISAVFLGDFVCYRKRNDLCFGKNEWMEEGEEEEECVKERERERERERKNKFVFVSSHKCYLMS